MLADAWATTAEGEAQKFRSLCIAEQAGREAAERALADVLAAIGDGGGGGIHDKPHRLFLALAALAEARGMPVGAALLREWAETEITRRAERAERALADERARRERAEKALRAHGRHGVFCPAGALVESHRGPCSCGLDSELAALAPATIRPGSNDARRRLVPADEATWRRYRDDFEGWKDFLEAVRETERVAVLEEAAEVLDRALAKHREESGHAPSWCEDFGCTPLEKYAEDVRALARKGGDRGAL